MSSSQRFLQTENRTICYGVARRWSYNELYFQRKGSSSIACFIIHAIELDTCLVPFHRNDPIYTVIAAQRITANHDYYKHFPYSVHKETQHSTPDPDCASQEWSSIGRTGQWHYKLSLLQMALNMLDFDTLDWPASWLLAVKCTCWLTSKGLL